MGAQVSVTIGEVSRSHQATMSYPLFEVAERAYRKAYGRDVAHIGSGGSIPFVAKFASAFPTAAILVTSAGADNDSAHGPDESVNLTEFDRACLVEALLRTELGDYREGPLERVGEAVWCFGRDQFSRDRID